MSDSILNNKAEQTNKPRTNIKDVQASKDNRHIYINKVGIKDVNYPLRIQTGDNTPQHTVAKVGMFVFLPEDKKGTHMSRFLEILDNHIEIDISHPRELLLEIKERLNTKQAFVEISFPYFIDKYAPITGKHSVMDYKVDVESSIDEDGVVDTLLKVEIPVTTLCPCSKEISEFGAHSQRGIVTLSLKYNGGIDINRVIRMVEDSSSSPLYPVLKREDEKFVTEEAYLNPVFVEDLTRNIVLNLETIHNITYLKCEVENMESIHKHNAYAMIERHYQ
jgi:GTP cyclohydrolase IB